MEVIKKGLACIFIILSFYSTAQVGFGIMGGFQQSVPLVMRDSFSGKPALCGALNFYIPINNKINLATGINYRAVAINHKIETSSFGWQTVALSIGNEWGGSKFKSTQFYTGISANYILGYGKYNLAGNASSGAGYKALKTDQKFVPAIELGITFKPLPFFNLKIFTIQPIPQTIRKGQPTLPGTLSFGIEYRITSNDIKNWKKDTASSPENLFASNLLLGTLYFIEDGTDSSQKVFRKIIAENYDFSKVNYIKGNNLRQSLDSFVQSPDSSWIFIVKAGSFVYNSNRAAAQGLIIYNYKMEDPVPDTPFFVRTLSGDSYFEDPLVVKKLIKSLNKRLYKMYTMYKK